MTVIVTHDIDGDKWTQSVEVCDCKAVKRIRRFRAQLIYNLESH